MPGSTTSLLYAVNTIGRFLKAQLGKHPPVVSPFSLSYSDLSNANETGASRDTICSQTVAKEEESRNLFAGQQ
jgi:hypothetical protein